MAYQKKYWINRFPICALVYKEAAELLGYDEAEAKSLGHSRAIFFAAAIRGFGASVPKPKPYASKEAAKKPGEMKKYYAVQDKLIKAGIDPESYDIVSFAGLETYVVLEDGDIRAFFGGKVIRPEDFSRAVEDKLVMAGGKEGYEKARSYIRDKLSDLSEAELNSGAVYKVYERLRDPVREIAFLEEKHVGIPA